MINLKIKWLLIIAVLIVDAIGITCSDPTSSDKAIVKILVSGPVSEGEYVIFWDGTNNKNEFVTAGTYYARLYSRDFTEQIEMTALEGGAGVSNDSTLILPGLQAWTELEQNTPNPFRIQDGTNIPFKLSDDMTIELTIRDRE